MKEFFDKIIAFFVNIINNIIEAFSPSYYGCPNSKRAKKLQLKKEILKR